MVQIKVTPKTKNPFTIKALPISGVTWKWHFSNHAGFWLLLRSWLRPHRGISQDKLPLYLGFFQFVHNARRRGKALLGALVAALVA